MWRSCERMGIRPPDVENQWNDNTPTIQSMLLAYEMIRQYEEAGGNDARKI